MYIPKDNKKCIHSLVLRTTRGVRVRWFSPPKIETGTGRRQGTSQGVRGHRPELAGDSRVEYHLELFVVLRDVCYTKGMQWEAQ